MLAFSGIVGIAGIVMSLVSIAITYKANLRRKLFHKHMRACHDHLSISIDKIRDGDLGQAELKLAAFQEELDRAAYYL